MNNGKRILAVLVMAMSLVGSLPLLVSAETVIEYNYGLATYTNGFRYSLSGGGWVEDWGAGTFCIPIPADLTTDQPLTVQNMGFVSSSAMYVVDASFNYVCTADGQRTDVRYTIQNDTLQGHYGGYFLLIRAEPNIAPDPWILVQGRQIDVIEANWTESVPSTMKIIETPDGTDTLVEKVLALWGRIINEIAPLLTPFYNSLLHPLALVLGVPVCLSLFALLFRSLLRR